MPLKKNMYIKRVKSNTCRVDDNTFEQGSPDKKNDQYDVWEGGGEVDNSARALDALDETTEDDDPRG